MNKFTKKLLLASTMLATVCIGNAAPSGNIVSGNGGAASLLAGPGIQINNSTIALLNTPSAQKTASYTLQSSDNGQDLHFCATSNITLTVPAISVAGFGYGSGYPIINDKTNSSGGSCTGSVLVTSATNIQGVINGPTTTLAPGSQINLEADPTNTFYSSSYYISSAGGSYPALTSPNATLNISGSGTSAMTADVAVPALPLAGGTLTGQVNTILGTVSAPAIQFGTSASGSGFFAPAGISGIQLERNGILNVTLGNQTLFGTVGSPVKTDASLTNTNGAVSAFQVHYGSSFNGVAAFIGYNTIGAYGGGLTVGHSSSNTVGTNTALTVNSSMGGLLFDAADGTNFTQGASFLCYEDVGTAAPGIAPARCEISTANAAGTVTPVIRYDSKQHEIIVTKNTVTASNWSGIGTSPPTPPPSNDRIGSIILGTSPSASAFVLTFANPYPNGASLSCNATDMTQATVLPMSAVGGTITSVTFKVPSTLTPAANDVITYNCLAGVTN